jgi:preprotein translocase subunit Sec61beta
VIPACDIAPKMVIVIPFAVGIVPLARQIFKVDCS